MLNVDATISTRTVCEPIHESIMQLSSASYFPTDLDAVMSAINQRPDRCRFARAVGGLGLAGRYASHVIRTRHTAARRRVTARCLGSDRRKMSAKRRSVVVASDSAATISYNIAIRLCVILLPVATAGDCSANKKPKLAEKHTHTRRAAVLRRSDIHNPLFVLIIIHRASQHKECTAPRKHGARKRSLEVAPTTLATS